MRNYFTTKRLEDLKRFVFNQRVKFDDIGMDGATQISTHVMTRDLLVDNLRKVTDSLTMDWILQGQAIIVHRVLIAIYLLHCCRKISKLNID